MEVKEVKEAKEAKRTVLFLIVSKGSFKRVPTRGFNIKEGVKVVSEILNEASYIISPAKGPIKLFILMKLLVTFEMHPRSFAKERLQLYLGYSNLQIATFQRVTH